MKRWIRITDEYMSKVKNLSRRKIRLKKTIVIEEFDRDGISHKKRVRLLRKSELWAYWDSYEGCFFWNNGEDGVYMDDPIDRPTHILVG